MDENLAGEVREWSMSEVHDIVTDAIPDHPMLVWRDRRLTFREVKDRSVALARFLVEAGLGVDRERNELERWECGQDRVALLMHNTPEHVISIVACWKARLVPCNVNYHYTPREIADLLTRLGARTVICERSLGDKLADIGADLDLVIEVADGTDHAAVPGAVDFHRALDQGSSGPALPVPTPDDLHIACTGGTTGHPKAVLWRQADLFVAAMGGAGIVDEDGLRARAISGAGVWFPTSPLMHVASQWTTFIAANMGATVVLHDDVKPFDARTILETAARERVNMMTIVGDAYARPLIDELRRTDHDLDNLAVIGTGGTPTSRAAKDALMELLPRLTIRDGYGASEIGAMASGEAVRDSTGVQLFPLGPSARLLSEDRSRFLHPGEDEVGWLARRGEVPLGYLDDEAATIETFPIVDGVRLAVPGDRAHFVASGEFVLVGRDSLVVNTGGEKVFVEEVEDVLKRHPDVVDAVVVGRPSDRFGQEVVGVVQRRPSADLEAGELRAWCKSHLAAFKAPRAFILVEQVERHPSGKANYRWAREVSAGVVST